MKGLFAVLMIMFTTLVLFTRALPMPSENLDQRLGDELHMLERLL